MLTNLHQNGPAMTAAQIDAYLRRIGLDHEALFEKIVGRRRGGVCAELLRTVFALPVEF